MCRLNILRLVFLLTLPSDHASSYGARQERASPHSLDPHGALYSVLLTAPSAHDRRGTHWGRFIGISMCALLHTIGAVWPMCCMLRVGRRSGAIFLVCRGGRPWRTSLASTSTNPDASQRGSRCDCVIGSVDSRLGRPHMVFVEEGSISSESPRNCGSGTRADAHYSWHGTAIRLPRRS